MSTIYRLISYHATGVEVTAVLSTRTAVYLERSAKFDSLRTSFSSTLPERHTCKSRPLFVYFEESSLQPPYLVSLPPTPPPPTHTRTHTQTERNITILQGPGDKQEQQQGKHQTAEAPRWVFC